ncbi:MAG: L,D-transpeptidase family protein [Pseudomonadota bacterium]
MRRGLLNRRTVLAAGSSAGLVACAPRGPTRFPTDHVFILKEQRRLYLINKTVPVAEYAIDLGFEPLGHKVQEGDGRTPEGLYWVDRKNPRSSFHLSVGINYPNEQDIEYAEALNLDPGGDIFIHGQPNGKYDPNDPDWTAGCVAVTNAEIEEIFVSVAVGTPVTIRA